MFRRIFGTIVGGFGSEQPVTDEVVTLTSGLKADIESKLGAVFETFEPKTFASQVVAGTNYRVKVHIGQGSHVHVKIHKPLPHKNEPPQLLDATRDETS